MADSLFDRVVIPVASEMDARRTCKAVLPHLRQTDGQAHVVHVIEHTEGYMDTASTEQLEQDAERIFDAARETFLDADFTSFETHLHYGTDVAETVYDACEEVDATAVVFVARNASRWKRLLTGDVALNLITENPYPAVVLPEADSGAESDADSETEVETESKSEVETESKSEVESKAKRESEPESKRESEPAPEGDENA